MSHDGNLCAAGCKDSTIRFWTTSAGTEIRRIRLEPRELACYIAFSPDGNLIVSDSVIGRGLRLWDIETGTERWPHPRHQGTVFSIACSPDGKSVASAGADGTLRIWDRATGKELRRILDVPLGIDGLFVMVDEICPISTAQFGLTASIAFSRGNSLGAVSQMGTIRSWELASGREVRRRDLEGSGVLTNVAFAPDGLCLATTGDDNILKLWNVTTGKEIRRCSTGHRDRIGAIAFSSDGKMIATTSDDGHQKIWASCTLDCLRDVSGFGNDVNVVSFGGDGKSICTGGFDAVLRVWDTDELSR